MQCCGQTPAIQVPACSNLLRDSVMCLQTLFADPDFQETCPTMPRRARLSSTLDIITVCSVQHVVLSALDHMMCLSQGLLKLWQLQESLQELDMHAGWLPTTWTRKVFQRTRSWCRCSGQRSSQWLVWRSKLQGLRTCAVSRYSCLRGIL